VQCYDSIDTKVKQSSVVILGAEIEQSRCRLVPLQCGSISGVVDPSLVHFFQKWHFSKIFEKFRQLKLFQHLFLPSARTTIPGRTPWPIAVFCKIFEKRHSPSQQPPPLEPPDKKRSATIANSSRLKQSPYFRRRILVVNASTSALYILNIPRRTWFIGLQWATVFTLL
jgi:hypothetical protein